MPVTPKLLAKMQQRPFCLGLGCVVLIQVCGLVGYIWLGHVWIVLGSLLAGLVSALGLAWIIGHAPERPLEDLSTLANSLAKDCEALSIALGDLGRGNLDVRVSVGSQPVNGLSFPQAAGLVDVLNTTVTSVHAAARGFNAFTCGPPDRVCYVGADSYLEGRICGEAMGQALDGQGQVVVTQSYSGAAPLELRRQGFENILREKYPCIQIVDIVETTFDLGTGYVCARDALERFPHLSGFYVTDGAIPYSVARAVNEAGAGGRIKIIGHDLVDETMHYLQEGVITATLSQDLFAQGHDSVIHLFNYLATGWRPRQPRLLTHLQLVTRGNYQQHWQPDRGSLETCEVMSRRLAQPIQPAARPLRIAVHNRNCSGVDQHLQMGALAAAARLRSFNASVTLISGGPLRVEAIIDSAVAQGFDALSVLAASNEDLPYLNRAAEAGMAVATYNAEPLSLRAWVASLADRTQELMGINQGWQLTQQAVAPRDDNGLQWKTCSEIIQRAIGFMQENLEDPIKVADVARFVGLDASYFCRLFTDQTGCNPREFLMDLRLKRAKYYLAHTQMSVMDVCVALGYSPSYFSRLFKRRVGCSPGQYAQHHHLD